MSDKTFVDTNVLIYAHDVDAKAKHEAAKKILRELWVERTGVLSTQERPEVADQLSKLLRALPPQFRPPWPR